MAGRGPRCGGSGVRAADCCPSRSLRPLGAFRPVGAMGNCHTVGPNEALVVSGEGAAGEVGLGRPVRTVLGVGWRCAWKGG